MILVCEWARGGHFSKKGKFVTAKKALAASARNAKKSKFKFMPQAKGV